MWSSDGTQIISMILVSGGATIFQAWSPITGQLVGPVLLTFNSEDVGFTLPSPNRKLILIAGRENVGIWDIGKRKLVSTLPVNMWGENAAAGVTWSPDNSKIAIGDFKSKVVKIWSVLDGEPEGSFTDHAGSLYWSPDGKYIAETTTQIYIWDVHTKRVIASFGQVGANQFIAWAAWSTDSRKLASSTINFKDFTQHTVNIWQLF
ncbi:MAG TPA: hypothetical protein VFN35_06680, partial [Ktedonobacteraceae bacterium]|nr:hypothetical protein [Ktedonobacteraceae bacterium]